MHSLAQKVVWQANNRRLSVENFDRENVDELIKICQYFFPCQNLCHTVLVAVAPAEV